MSLPFRYATSFFIAILFISLSFFFDNIFLSGTAFSQRNLSWVVIFLRYLFNYTTAIQYLSIIFTFCFFTNNNDLNKYKGEPLKFFWILLALYSLSGGITYILKEWISPNASRQILFANENRDIAFSLKVKLTELQIKKNYISQKISNSTNDSNNNRQVTSFEWQRYNLLDEIYHTYFRYSLIDNQSDIQSDLIMAKNERDFHKPKTPEQIIAKIPFYNLNYQQLIKLSQNFERQKDYSTALYLMFILREVYPNHLEVKKRIESLNSLLEKWGNNSKFYKFQNELKEKQSYYLDFESGNRLKAFYGIKRFLRDHPDDKESINLLTRIQSTIETEYVFESQISDYFDSAGYRSFFFLNSDDMPYKEYIYIGKISFLKNKPIMRDISIFRFSDSGDIILFLSIPYASFSASQQKLIFNVIDEEVDNPYLRPTLQKGLIDIPAHWPLKYSLDILPIFSLNLKGNLENFSLKQIYKSLNQISLNENKANCFSLISEFLLRCLSPFIFFIITSFWMTGFIIKSFILDSRHQLATIIIASFSIKTLASIIEFIFKIFISVFGFLITYTHFLSALFLVIILLAFLRWSIIYLLISFKKI